MKFHKMLVLGLFLLLMNDYGFGQIEPVRAITSSHLNKKAQSEHKRNDSSDKESIQIKKKAEIDIKVLAISNNKPLNKVIIDSAEEFLDNIPDNGAMLTGYFKGDDLVKIQEWIGLSNKIVFNNYFFENGKLLYVTREDSSYQYDEKTQSFDYNKLNVTSSTQYYLKNEILIFGNQNKMMGELRNKEEIKSFLYSIRKYKSLLYKKLKR